MENVFELYGVRVKRFISYFSVALAISALLFISLFFLPILLFIVSLLLSGKSLPHVLSLYRLLYTNNKLLQKKNDSERTYLSK